MTSRRRRSSITDRTVLPFWCITLVLSISSSNSWVVLPSTTTLSHHCARQQQLPVTTPFSHPNTRLHKSAGDDVDIAIDDLMEMDVVVYSEKDDDDGTSKQPKQQQRQLGAVQSDGRITPMCVWTMEPAFRESLEFLVDEEDLLPGFQLDQIVIHSVVPQDALSYGSRQVGGGMGPGNPHGEESEQLYYIDQSILEGIEFTVKPELEIFW